MRASISHSAPTRALGMLLPLLVCWLGRSTADNTAAGTTTTTATTHTSGRPPLLTLAAGGDSSGGLPAGGCQTQLRDLRDAVASFCAAHPQHHIAHLCHAFAGSATRPQEDTLAATAAPRDRGSVSACAAEDGGGGKGDDCTAAEASPETLAAAASVTAPLRLPVVGRDVCVVLREHCGVGVGGQLCLKRHLEQLLPSDPDVEHVRRTMIVPPEFYFLCSGDLYGAAFHGLAGLPGGNTPRAAALTALLRRATAAVAHGDPSVLQEYHDAARWSALEKWAPAEKLCHFLDALTIHPDNLHCLDRLATLLAEVQEGTEADTPGAGTDTSAADSPANATASDRGPGATTPAAASIRGARVYAKQCRALLLHYAVLRGIIATPLQRPLNLMRGLHTAPVWHPGETLSPSVAMGMFPDAFAWIAVLEREENVATMRQELLTPLTSAGVGEEQREGIHHGHWQEVHLIRQGREEEGAADRFPGTMAILRQTGAHFINARTSTVRAGTHITPHCGISNAKLRGHLGLHIPIPGGTAQVSYTANHAQGDAGASLPQPRSALRVGQQQLGWRPGKVIVFDDSFEHEVWWQWAPRRNSESPRGDPTNDPAAAATTAIMDHRVVLIVDVFHPQLSPSQRASIEASFSTSNS